MPQPTPVHDGWPLAGDSHASQLCSPQLLVLSFGEQKAPQTCVPAGHSPSHGVPLGMQVVLHTS